MENGGGKAFPGEKNGKAVQALQRTIGEVQELLERNRMLIQEISQNHEAREADGLNRNVTLIRELNANINRVVSLYSDLSSALVRSLDLADAAKKRQRPPQ